MNDDGLILILSGGVSRRMGRPKALLPLYGGSRTTFLQRLARLAQGMPGRRAVVSSLPAQDLGVELPLVRQERPEEGQLSSLLLGWQAFGEGADWLMVLLVDHPYVARSTLEALLQARRDNPSAFLWTPSYQRRGGHPVLFSWQLVKELESAPLEQGARPVVRRHGARRCRVEVDDPAILWDVDTPEQYDLCSGLFRARPPLEEQL
jgi:CTP:molybdopterin cytidylyltransferase MocA